MKKKILSIVLAAAMVFSLTACADDSTSSADDSTSSADVTTAADSQTEETVDIKIGMVTDVGGVNDGSFNQTSWEGLLKAQDDFGITVKYLESATDSDYIPNIETFIDEDYDLIICVGYQLADATRTEAEAYPDQKFAIIDDSTNADLSNVTCLMFEQAQASYLVGYVAGLTTETDIVGFVVGMSFETMNQFGYGYCAGVIDSNPDATILQSNANSFTESAVGKTAANTMIASDADVIFHAAGGTGLGVIDACTEAGIWAIGVDTDQSVISPDTVLTSAMKRVDVACYDIAEDLLNDSVESGVITYTLTDGGVDLAPTTDNLSQEVIDEITEVKEKIINGEIIVPSNQTDFEATYGDVYELD